MRIREIVYESALLPFKKYKIFLVLILLSALCEIISDEFYSLEIGQMSLALMAVNSVITLIIIGIMMSITQYTCYNEKMELDVKKSFIEGLKEYFITIYYIILTFIASLLFIIPTGVYSRLMHIHEYIISMNINETALTLHELSHQLPVNLQINLQQSLQVNILMSLVVFIIFSSFAYIGRTILYKTDDMKKALDPRLHAENINQIGFRRYVKFIALIGLIMIVLFNTIILLDYFLDDILISAIFESYTLLFATNAFYLLMD